jgi:hypothetical protein
MWVNKVDSVSTERTVAAQRREFSWVNAVDPPPSSSRYGKIQASHDLRVATLVEQCFKPETVPEDIKRCR